MLDKKNYRNTKCVSILELLETASSTSSAKANKKSTIY